MKRGVRTATSEEAETILTLASKRVLSATPNATDNSRKQPTKKKQPQKLRLLQEDTTLCRLLRSHSVHNFLAITIQLLHRTERIFKQQRQVVENTVHDLFLPLQIELDLIIEPAFQPLRVRQTGL